MTKDFCDCCGKEIKSHNYGHIFEWYCHLTEICKGRLPDYEV